VGLYTHCNRDARVAVFAVSRCTRADYNDGMTSISVQNVLRWNDGNAVEVAEDLAPEEPLEIRVRGRAISVTMRTPGNDEELAAGFLFTEGIIRSRTDILEITPCTKELPDGNDNNVLNVLLAPEVNVDFARLTRHVFTSSSCGVCGKASIDAIRQTMPSINSVKSIAVSRLLELPEKLRQAQAAFDATGGIHAAGLFTCNGEAIVVREDVGRHNAVDKVIGHSLMHERTPDVLMVSGRTSFEILQKAAAARIPIIAAVSAPSSLAVEFAHEMGQTLIGFLRGRRMNIYTHPSRVEI
jgi:FdhD protein